ncbi:hypothetical protein [Paramaledivibacter caminithermalis]|jgi:multidrug transporter EmrE-like cation transporter|uniref:Uncharacterized protein n=1 Tax=Paramaledivibacter caminithermalis (strain DSM 15212 / CIP 107654 / DViRD3) TaxID=1121301 RepID=A0A1M6M037_PARC5|nr:hypothetical protein [Paramaledivibacter caminithermalis]SHJ76798.1 hypothetical protein SAMN02745912_01005 [Paramaledivibacter caminithermalis DSM 15212]
MIINIGAIVLKEKVTLIKLISEIIIITGVYLNSKIKIRNTKIG